MKAVHVQTVLQFDEECWRRKKTLLTQLTENVGYRNKKDNTCEL
jgi:hypothetical protein